MGNELLKLFVLGIPGSGKSTVAQEIAQYMQNVHMWNTSYVNDYDILWQMYQEQGGRFRPAEYGGFTIADPTVYNEVLQKLKWQVEGLEQQATAGSSRLILIEFARSNYRLAFEFLEADFLKGAFFLFLDADIDICMERTYRRVFKAQSEKSKNDYFVSPSVFDRYHRSNNGAYLRSVSFKDRYQVSDQRLKIITNSDLLQASSIDEIHRFADVLVSVRPIAGVAL